MNRVQLVGNSSSMPDIRVTGSGKKWARFSMTTRDSYWNSKGEKVTDVQWHRLVAWGKVAEVAEKLQCKGAEISVEGRLVSRSYLDKDGNKKYITEIVVDELKMKEEDAKANG